jgi:hypothetical protein
MWLQLILNQLFNWLFFSFAAFYNGKYLGVFQNKHSKYDEFCDKKLKTIFELPKKS